MVGVSYWLSGPLLPTVGAESADDLLRAYVAKDTDNDGLSDWQEALYGSDPKDPSSIVDGMRDADAVAQGLVKPRFETQSPATNDAIQDVPGVDAKEGTLTDRFAKTFLQNYLQAQRAGSLSNEQKQALVASALSEFDSVRPDEFSYSDVKTSGSGAPALLSYAKAAESVLLANALHPEKNELEYVFDGAINGDADGLVQANKIGEAHEAIGRALITVSVPAEARYAHLRLANAFVRAGETIKDMASFDTDPFLALLAVGKYEASKREIVDAYAALYPFFKAQGVTISTSEPGYFFYNGAVRSQALQTALKEAETQ